MGNTDEVPDWLVRYVRLIRERDDDILMFELRGLVDEARDARELRAAIIRQIAKRLTDREL